MIWPGTGEDAPLILNAQSSTKPYSLEFSHGVLCCQYRKCFVATDWRPTTRHHILGHNFLSTSKVYFHTALNTVNFFHASSRSASKFVTSVTSATNRSNSTLFQRGMNSCRTALPSRSSV